MTLRELELFIDLVKNPHLSQVARENRLTQSAVSMAIKSLENALEKKLFDRINKKLVLNENGRFFYRMVEPHVFGLRESEIIFKDQDLRGDIKVAASSSLANYILPQIFYDFMEQYDGVRIQTVTGNTREVARLIETAQVDIGFVEGEYTSPHIQREVLGIDKLYVITGDKELVRHREYDFDELLLKRWILREKGSGTRETFLSHLGKSKKRLAAFREMNHTEAIKSVLHNTGAISCLSRVSVRTELAASQLFRLKIKGFDFTRSFYTIWHKDKHFSSVMQEFAYFTTEAYKAL
ncbi:MAG: LysR family transcriptional regulator [Desulfobacterales bacterium]|nr:LysR family transcriptional regulator [Desulfobacterales bacterium]